MTARRVIIAACAAIAVAYTAAVVLTCIALDVLLNQPDDGRDE